MPFLPPNQQRKSIGGKTSQTITDIKKNKSTKLAYHNNATAGGPSHGHRQYATKIIYLYFTEKWWWQHKIQQA